MIMDNLTYVYQSGRLKRSRNQDNYPKEFFYGLDELRKSFSDTKVIEFEEVSKTKISRFFYQLLRKLSGLPFYTEHLNSLKNKKILFNSNLIVLTNQRMGFSCLPLLIVSKFIKKQSSCVFIMGLYNVKVKNSIKKFFRKSFIYIFMIFIDKLIFLSEGEYNYAKNKFNKFSDKFIFIPFSIDTDFWKVDNKKKRNGKKILFIGNDGKRDYDFAINLAKELEELEFTFVTKKIAKEDLMSNNIELISGIWSEETLSDEEIRDLYSNSDLVIIPIIESLQPSGQSVALQAMGVGTPVLITETEGFWEPKIYKNHENIIFLKENNIEEWKKEIMYILNNEDIKQYITKNAMKTVNKNNNLINFNKAIRQFLL